jgi:hypothetical protein
MKLNLVTTRKFEGEQNAQTYEPAHDYLGVAQRLGFSSPGARRLPNTITFGGRALGKHLLL